MLYFTLKLERILEVVFFVDRSIEGFVDLLYREVVGVVCFGFWGRRGCGVGEECGFGGRGVGLNFDFSVVLLWDWV